MRKLLLAGLLAVSLSGFAQKLDDVQRKYSDRKYDEAKQKIDEILAEPKNQNKPNGWYWKGKVYTELARLDSGERSFEQGKAAFEAFKRYQTLDESNKLGLLEQNVGLFQLYDLFYNQGIVYYNKKDYAGAYERMKLAADIEDYAYQKGFSYNDFSFPALDTQLVHLTASAAYLAKKEDEAIPYWEKIANARVADEDYREVYSTLADYYIRKKNQTKADKYLAQGRELFPDDNFWTAIEFGDPGGEYREQMDHLNDRIVEAKDDAERKKVMEERDALEAKIVAERMARFDQMVKKYPKSYPLAMDYAIESFNDTYGHEVRPQDYTSRQERTGRLLVKAIELNPTSAIANYVMAQHVYNQIYDLEEAQRQVRGSAAADVAKRKEFTTKINQKYEEVYGYALATYDIYTAQGNLNEKEKINLRKSIDILIDYHDRKKQADKVAMYEAKKKELMK